MSALQDYLITLETNQEPPINLYDKITSIKQSSKTWLEGLGKNGYSHSKRLEEYLDVITENVRGKKLISPEEVFILLCAVYMHDIGYRDGGDGHALRSREMVLEDPSTYQFGAFPPFGGNNYSRCADAVGWVCCGHDSNRIQLSDIQNDFTDMVFKNPHLDLRKVTALLRLADEADDPYIRFNPSRKSIRDSIPLVEVEGNNVIWYWERTQENDLDQFQHHIDKKITILNDSIEYLQTIGMGHWNLVLRPQSVAGIPFMAGVPVETFVGRIPDLEKIHAIIHKRGAGAITGVRGIGGIGKTELARMYAKRYRNEYPGGVFWASLKGSSWKEEAGKIIASKSPRSPSFPDQQKAIEFVLRGVLSRKDALLIIDNVDDAQDIIKPACSVLVTTRDENTFRKISKDAIFEIKPLQNETGIELLAKVIGNERVDADRTGALRLVDILGGLPLAIDVAAQHLRDVPHLGFPEYIGKVQNKIDELHIGANKDRDVRASLELSLDQLKSEPNGNELLCLFVSGGVCAASGFSYQTLGHAAGLDTFIDNDVGQLVAKLHFRSLLEYSAELKRYSMHPLMRQIAEGKLKNKPDESKILKKNHCSFFLQYAEMHNSDPYSLIFERDGIWQALIQANELDNSENVREMFIKHLSLPYLNLIHNGRIKEAFDYLGDMNLIYINNLGEARKLVSFLELLTNNLSALDDNSKASVHTSKGIGYVNLGEYQKAIDEFEKARVITHKIGDVKGEADILGNLGVALKNLCRYKEAIDRHEKALMIHHQLEDVEGEGKCFLNIGVIHAILGENRKAIDRYEKCLAIKRRLGDFQGQAGSLMNIGIAYRELRKYPDAIDYFGKALEIYRRIGNAQGIADTLSNLGVTFKIMGNCPEAIQRHEEALEIYRRIEDVQGEGIAHTQIGVAYLKLGKFEDAKEHFEKSLVINHRIGNVRSEGISLANISLVYANLGDKITARQFLKDAKTIFQTLDLDNMIKKMEEIERNLGS